MRPRLRRRIQRECVRSNRDTARRSPRARLIRSMDSRAVVDRNGRDLLKLSCDCKFPAKPQRRKGTEKNEYASNALRLCAFAGTFLPHLIKRQTSRPEQAGIVTTFSPRDLHLFRGRLKPPLTDLGVHVFRKKIPPVHDSTIDHDDLRID